MLTKTDFLGSEYGPGDIVIYAQQRDRSINMIKAQVIEVKENGNVKVQPLGGSRWKGHSGKSYYVDTRTGKRIDPWRGKKHAEVIEHYVFPDGKKMSVEEYRLLNYYERSANPGKYVHREFKDYVESRTEPTKAVTLTVTENIVKFADGQLPVEV